MPDYNPAVASGINAQGPDVSGTLNTLAGFQQRNAQTGLLQLQQLQQQRQYNALQAAAQDYRAGRDPLPGYLANGGDPSQAPALQNSFANQQFIGAHGGLNPQGAEATANISNLQTQNQINQTKLTQQNMQVRGSIAQGMGTDDASWKAGIDQLQGQGHLSPDGLQRLQSAKTPEQRQALKSQLIAASMSPDTANALHNYQGGEGITTPAQNLTGGAPGASGQGGIQPLSPQQKEYQQQVASKSVDYLQGDGYKKYSNAQSLMASMTNIDHDIEALGPGWMGAGAETKGEFAKGWNSLVDTIPGLDANTAASAKFDPSKISSWEEFNKEQIRAGMQLINSNFGGSREAASIVQMGKTANAGVSNSYLGAKYVSSTIKAAAQRESDLYEYQAQHTNQLPAQSAIEFNRANPPQMYAMKGITNVIPDGAKQYLAQHPESADKFNKNFGSGTAQYILSNPAQ